MATTAFKGQGTLLKMGEGSPPTYTTVYEVVSIGGFGQMADLIEVTHLESTRKEYIGGLPDGVQFPMIVNYNPTNPTHVDLKAAADDGLAHPFQLQMPSGGGSLTFTFGAVVMGWQFPSITANEAYQAEFTLKISGDIIGPV
jgi:hypothetical protein